MYGMSLALVMRRFPGDLGDMAQLQYVLNEADMIAVVQAFVASHGHEMDATTPPQFLGNGTVVVELNS